MVHALSGPSVALDQPHAIGVRKDGTYFGPTEFYDSLFDSDERIEALLEALEKGISTLVRIRK